MPTSQKPINTNDSDLLEPSDAEELMSLLYLKESMGLSDDDFDTE